MSRPTLPGLLPVLLQPPLGITPPLLSNALLLRHTRRLSVTAPGSIADERSGSARSTEEASGPSSNLNVAGTEVGLVAS